MTTLSVRKEIQHQMGHGVCGNAMITEPKMNKIGKEAEKGGVTPGEALAINDILVKGHEQTIGGMMTEMCPEHPASYVMYDQGAKKAANALFVRNDLPYGENLESMKGRVEATLTELKGNGPVMDKTPNTKGMHEIDLTNHLMADGPIKSAFVNPRAGTFVVKVSPGFMHGPNAKTQYYGPNLLAADPAMVTAVQTAYDKLDHSLEKVKLTPGDKAKDLPPLLKRYVAMKFDNAEGYGYGAPEVGKLKLADGSSVFVVTGIQSDTVDSVAFFTPRGQPIVMAEDGQGGFGYSSVWPDPREKY
ncbi:MAG: hypothetical protein U1E65_30180 [Myxococcota bacterium]